MISPMRKRRERKAERSCWRSREVIGGKGDGLSACGEIFIAHLIGVEFRLIIACRRAGHTRRENGADSAKGGVFRRKLPAVPFCEAPICANQKSIQRASVKLAKAPVGFFLAVDSVAEFNK